MNLKRWITWVCLVLMLVAEVMVFRANHERDQAMTDLHEAQLKLQQAQTDLEALKNSDTGQQASLIAFLKTQNASLTAKVAALQKTVDQLKAESQQTSEHLTTARTALQLQQDHLAQLQAEQQQQTLLANAIACINNLRTIVSAKDQWALEKQKTATDVPTVQDLLPYFKDGTFPVCPEGGTYSINAEGELPTCTIQGHVLPAQ